MKSACRVSKAIIVLSLTLLSVVHSVYAEDPPAAPELKEPRLVITEPLYDFGTVRQGDKVEHQFEIANQGQKALEIGKIHPSCGCTAAVIDTPTLAPGEKTMVKATFDSTGFQGQKTKTIRVYTNDPQQTSAVLTLKGLVKADIRLEPAAVLFGNVTKGKRYTADATVTVEDGVQAKLLEIESRSKDLEATWQDIPGTTAKKVTVTLKETAPLGAIRGRIVVKTSSDKSPILNIPVVANVEGDITLAPDTVSFGLIDGPLDKVQPRTVLFSNRSTQAIKVESVSSDNDSVSTELSTLEEGKRYALKVGLKDKATGVVRARIKITTSHPEKDQRELFLPVYAIIGRAGE